jgi:hypothetical protein
MHNQSDFRKRAVMKHRIPVGIILSVFVVLLLPCGITASASAAPVSGSGEAAIPANTEDSKNSEHSEHSDAALQITISVDRAAATTSLRSAPINISADLSRADEPVPDGTVVVFAISSGTGTLSGATTTVEGIATVRLASTTVGTVIVSATAEAVSADISASFLAQPKQAFVKVATVGAPASGTPIGDLLASVTYPAGGYAIASGGASPSGVASGATTIFAANVETAGQVILALLDVNGIQTGEFANLTFQVTDGFLPNISDFSVSPAARNATTPGIGVVVQSLTLR